MNAQQPLQGWRMNHRTSFAHRRRSSPVSLLFNTVHIEVYKVCLPIRASADESESNYPQQPVWFFFARLLRGLKSHVETTSTAADARMKVCRRWKCYFQWIKPFGLWLRIIFFFCGYVHGRGSSWVQLTSSGSTTQVIIWCLTLNHFMSMSMIDPVERPAANWAIWAGWPIFHYT